MFSTAELECLRILLSEHIGAHDSKVTDAGIRELFRRVNAILGG